MYLNEFKENIKKYCPFLKGIRSSVGETVFGIDDRECYLLIKWDSFLVHFPKRLKFLGDSIVACDYDNCHKGRWYDDTYTRFQTDNEKIIEALIDLSKMYKKIIVDKRIMDLEKDFK